MNIVNVRRWRSCLAVVLALVMLAASFGIYVPQAEAMGIMWFEPASTLVSSDASGDYYKVNDAIQPDKVHFKWNFSNGMDRPIAEGSLQYVTLWKKNKDNNNTEIPLVRKVDGSGDFRYTKAGGSGSSGGTRLLELILQSTTLQQGTTYIVKLGANLSANNGGTLEKPYSWEFTTSGVSETDPPTWPDKNLSVSNLSPLSLDLTWSSAADSSGVKQYKIYKNQTELETVDGNTRNYRVAGLTPDTGYTFKVEASDGVNWSIDGPLASVTTPGPDNVTPTWPTGSELKCTKRGEKTVTLQWTAAKDNYGAISYKIYKDDKDPITVDDTTTCNITGLTGDTTYIFKVEAGDEAGNWTDNGPSLSVTTSLDGTAPNWENASITVSNLLADRLTLEWTPAIDQFGVVGYQIFQNSNLIGTVNDANTYNYNVTGMQPTTKYTFKIEAFDAAGNTSSDGPTKTVTTPRWTPTAGAGFNFALTAPASTNVSLDNTLVYNNVDGFVDGERCYFCWDFENGLDETTYLQNITLKKKDNGEIIALAAADFKYTKENEPKKIRRLELILTSTKLAADTSYVIELGADLSANNGTKLGRTYCWEFKTWPGSNAKTRLACSIYSASFLDRNGNFWAWGDCRYQQLGIGDPYKKIMYSTIPIRLEGLTGVAALAPNYHYMALKEDGTVWTWGRNNYGQLGNGTRSDSSVPAQVEGLAGVRIKQIRSALYRSMALAEDGTVWDWGMYRWTQSGETVQSSIPVQVTNLTNVIQIAAGNYHGMALKDDGSIWAWGTNSEGQLGNNTKVDSLTPVKVSGDNKYTRIAVGDYHSAAIKDDGTVWCWGNDQYGIGQKLVPTRVEGLSGVIDIGVGSYMALVLKDDGTVRAWGKNQCGALGIGNTTNSSTPVQPDLSQIGDIEVGGLYCLALQKDGKLWTWGDNSRGQLGVGSTSDVYSPVPVLLDISDTTPPQWAEGVELTAINPTCSSVELNWSPAQDAVAYKIFALGQ